MGWRGGADGGNGPEGDRLESWKQIAAYFGRDERTVKRWEAQRGLPLHRLPGAAGAKVYAFRGELHAWLRGDGGAVAASAPAPRPWRAWALGSAAVVGVVALLSTAFWLGRVDWSVPSSASGPKGRADDPVAAEFYRTGLYYAHALTPETLRQAIDYFTQAIVRDPSYADAYAGLADSYILLGVYSDMPAREAYPRARAAAERAIALDPGLADAHAALGYLDAYWSREPAAARREFERALKLDPRSAITHQWYADALTNLGRDDEALAEIGTAQNLDPGSSAVLADRGRILLGQGRTDEAVTLLESVEQIAPGLLTPHSYLSGAYLIVGRDTDALREMEAAARLLHDERRVAMVGAARQALASGGRQGMLRALLRLKQQAYLAGGVSAFELAQTCAALGMTDATLRLLRTSVDRRETETIGLSRDPAFAALRGLAEFRDLARRASLQTPPDTPERAPRTP